MKKVPGMEITQMIPLVSHTVVWWYPSDAADERYPIMGWALVVKHEEEEDNQFVTGVILTPDGPALVMPHTGQYSC